VSCPFERCFALSVIGYMLLTEFMFLARNVVALHTIGFAVGEAVAVGDVVGLTVGDGDGDGDGNTVIIGAGACVGVGAAQPPIARALTRIMAMPININLFTFDPPFFILKSNI